VPLTAARAGHTRSAVAPRLRPVAAGKRIAILFHEREAKFDQARYLVHQLVPFWREDGHEVFYLFGTEKLVPADLVVVHVDLSVVPDRYLEFAARYPAVVNGRLRDIRKSTTSKILVRPGDGWTGPVIVKSDRNDGGDTDRLLEPSFLGRRTRLDRLRRRLLEVVGLPSIASWRHYRVFERADEVPALWFRRRDIVVERFLPEFEDGRYYYRQCLFLGDRAWGWRIGSLHPVFKFEDRTSADFGEPHPETEAWREEFGVDYGKFDYVVHDGKPVLLDLNKTTGAAGDAGSKMLEEELRYQAEGIDAYL
jgi:hypothetical protein